MNSRNKAKVNTRKIVETMWAMGMPSRGREYADIVRAAMRAGLSYDQAFALARDAYHASKGYSFNLAEGSQLHAATRRRNAEQHPNGKDAEDLAAEREGRPSRWGTAEFHRQPG